MTGDHFSLWEVFVKKNKNESDRKKYYVAAMSEWRSLTAYLSFDDTFFFMNAIPAAAESPLLKYT